MGRDRAGKIRGQVKNQGSAKPRQSSTPPVERSATAATPRQKPVRKSISLGAALNRRVQVWQLEAADELGVARVTFQDVVEALSAELVDDPELGIRIRNRISQQSS